MPDSDYKYEGVTSCHLYVLNIPVRHLRKIK
jgi:hypothetical protein